MTNQKRRLILFARFPVPGKVKTRLIPALGTEGAAALHRRLVLRTLRAAIAACRMTGAILEIRFDGDSEDAIRHWLGDDWFYRPQATGDLGQRMAGAFEDSFREGSSATILIGSDCPSLTADLLADAFEQLANQSVVFGPAGDGGYYLIGLKRLIPELFDQMPWGTQTVLERSLKTLEQKGVQPLLLKRLNDIDRAEDLSHWKQMIEMEEKGPGHVSVVIPTLNEAKHIMPIIEAIRQGRPHEIIVADGGSSDGTLPLAKEAGVTAIHSKPCCARQMNAGAARATGNILLFLHADTRLPRAYVSVASKALNEQNVAAGAFRFSIGENFHGKRMLEWVVHLRSRWLQMPYGDQALFLKKSLFEEMGGFADLPIMEDYEFIRRLRRRGRIVTAEANALTSGRRWLRLGMFRTTAINQLVVAGYHLGVSPAKLANFYRRD